MDGFRDQPSSPGRRRQRATGAERDARFAAPARQRAPRRTAYARNARPLAAPPRGKSSMICAIPQASTTSAAVIQCNAMVRRSYRLRRQRTDCGQSMSSAPNRSYRNRTPAALGFIPCARDAAIFRTLPIRMPVANTSAPPKPTCSAAEKRRRVHVSPADPADHRAVPQPPRSPRSTIAVQKFAIRNGSVWPMPPSVVISPQMAPRIQRRAAPGQAAVVRQRFGEAHRDAGADARPPARPGTPPTNCRWRRPRRTPAPAWTTEPSISPASPGWMYAQHEQAPRRLVLLARAPSRAGSPAISRSAVCSCCASASARSPSSLRIEASVRAAGGLAVETLRLRLHQLRLLAHHLQPQRMQLPDRRGAA